MGLIGCPETLVRNYQYMLCNSPEGRNSHLLCARSLKSCTAQVQLYSETTVETDNIDQCDEKVQQT